MSRYDDTFVDRFLEPWNRHDVDGALGLMTDNWRLKLDPAKAVPAMISHQYDENADPEAFYEGRTWPTEDGFAYIICHDCGELDEEGRFFEKNTVYSTRGDFTAHPDERCNVCKGYGFLRVGL